MTHPVERAAARSRVFQLLALAFGHPVEELHGQLIDGRFQTALRDAREQAYGETLDLPRSTLDFATFEAQYIELFAVGHRGRPAVPLCAGEYDDLLDGRPRPSFMLQYVQFYRHFGVRARDEGEDNELPDHLTCQLEFMAWLAHLEAEAFGRQTVVEGYRRAQRDFVVKLMSAFCERTAVRLEREAGKRGSDPLFAALGWQVNDFVRCNRRELESVLGVVDAPADTRQDRTVSVTKPQNLWG